MQTQAIAQGFEWVYSYRMPFSVPTFYVGFGSGVGIASHSGSIESVSGSFVCARFPSVTAPVFSFGVTAEYWIYGRTALTFSGLYQSQSAHFSELSERIPLSDGNFLQTRYELSTNRPTLKVTGGAKTLLFDTHAWIGGSIALEYLLQSSSQLQEKMVSPEGVPFETTPPSFVITYPGNTLDGMRTVVAVPCVNIGYDIELGRGLYASPSIGYSLPLMSQSSAAQWNVSTVWAELKILYGINPQVLE